MICKRRGFVIQHYSELRDLEANLLSMVCNFVEVEPVLQGITEEQLMKGSNRAQDARLDQDHEPQQIYRIHENDKKQLYSRRVLDVEHGSFTPLVFTTTGGMGKECIRYHSGLAELVATIKAEKITRKQFPGFKQGHPFSISPSFLLIVLDSFRFIGLLDFCCF